MLDLPRLERIDLSPRPLTQRAVGQLLRLNFGWLPGVRIDLEGLENLPSEPVIFAMNHTDRYNYFPFQVALWRRLDRFTATWVKGKYYESWVVGTFMEKTNQLPTVSRGYLITRDFVAVEGRPPSDDEYHQLRQWVDAVAFGEAGTPAPPPGAIPEAILKRPRNVLGLDYDPEKTDYAGYIVALFRAMMTRFVELNAEAAPNALDLLIFPQGTRSRRLLPSHIGISQIALHLKQPIVPVGCNGSDRLYPGGLPFAKKGHVVYRIGAPLPYEKLAAHHVDVPFTPFLPEDERRHRTKFEALAGEITDRIEALLDAPYRRAAGVAESDAVQGADRFV